MMTEWISIIISSAILIVAIVCLLIAVLRKPVDPRKTLTVASYKQKDWEGVISLKFVRQANGLVWEVNNHIDEWDIMITKEKSKNPYIGTILIKKPLESDHLRQLIVWMETGQAPNVIVKNFEDEAIMKTRSG